MGDISHQDVLDVDRWLAEPKTLRGDPPIWHVPDERRPLAREATWLIDDVNEIPKGELRVRVVMAKRDYLTAVIIFRTNAVMFLNRVADNHPERNPPWAQAVGLPGRFTGTHCHGWEDNRANVLATQSWQLAGRRPVRGVVTPYDVLAWICAAGNISLPEKAAHFDVPKAEGLFGDAL